MENKPNQFPTAWPTDGRSTLRNSDKGWRLSHPQRDPHIYREGRWIEESALQQVAA